MQTTYTAFGPPKASAFVHDFRRTWWPGRWWSRGLIKEKVTAAYRIDALDETYDARERMVNLLHTLTALHLLDHSRWLMSLVASLLINLLVFTTIPTLSAQVIVTRFHLVNWLIIPFSLTFRLILLWSFKIAIATLLAQLPLYRRAWALSIETLHLLYQHDHNRLLGDAHTVQTLDGYFPVNVMNRIATQFPTSTNLQPTV